jgi:two-component sensor histidine kinase
VPVLDVLRRARAAEDVVNSYRIVRRSDGEVRWIRNTDVPLFDADGRLQRLGGISHDAADEVEARERLEVPVAELQRRARNLSRVVSSIAKKTMTYTGPTEAFREEFSQRLDALSRGQGLLSRAEQEPITLDALLWVALDALGASEGEAVRLKD